MAPHGLLRRLSCPVLIGLSLVLSGAAQSAHAGGSTAVPDTKPGWATPANSSGEASDSGTVVFSMWLGWRDRPQLDALLAAQQDPSSDGYHHWLSPQQFRDLFAPDSSSVASVSAWLRAQGFELVSVPDNRLFVTASGTVAQVERAFQVNESLYDVSGQTVRAPDANPRIPDDLAASVTAITGLDNAYSLARPQMKTPAPPPPAGTSVGPCSHYWGEHTSRHFPNPYAPGKPLPWLICGYTPQQIASAYGIDQLQKQHLDGRGQTIAITGAFFSPTIRADLNRFSRTFGLPHAHYSELVAPGLDPLPA